MGINHNTIVPIENNFTQRKSNKATDHVFVIDAAPPYRALELPANIDVDYLKLNPFMMDAAEFDQEMTTIETLAALLNAASKKPKQVKP